MENRFSSIFYSLLVHAGLIALLLFSMNFPIAENPEKFKVMVYETPKVSTSPAERSNDTSLLSDKDSSGASRLGEENRREPMRGLKKGINSPESPPVAMPPGMSAPPPVPPVPGVIAENSSNKKTVNPAGQKGKSDGVDKTKLNEEGIFKGERKGLEDAAAKENKEKDIPEDKKRELEKLLAAVRKTPAPQEGSKGVSPPLGLDRETLSKLAGLQRGLGGEDEEGEGGTGTVPSTGKVVSLETKDFKYFSYFRHLKELIEGVWVYPKVARERGIDGGVAIQFTIDIDGKLVEAKVLKSSGYFFLDDAALKALKDTSPFPPLPKRWEQDSITIAGSFTYFLYNFRR